MQIDLLKLQFEANFYGKCFTCGELVPPDRLAKGADTCKPEHQNEKRRAQRRFQHLLAVERLLSRRKVRRIAIDLEAQETAARTAHKATEENQSTCQ